MGTARAVTSPTCTIYPFDCVDTMLHLLDERSVHCVVTSPPYFNLRDYGHAGQMGREPTVDEYVENLVQVARAVRRVLRDDGTFWLNLGDGYASTGGNGRQGSTSQRKGRANVAEQERDGSSRPPSGFRAKDRLMVPARVALALHADGWHLRDEIVWHKPRTTPHPVRDRTVAAHEMLYLLTKKPRYFFDWAAIEEPAKYAGETRQTSRVFRQLGEARDAVGKTSGARDGVFVTRPTRRKRSVWSISPTPYKHAHFATFPPGLVEPCILAGSPRYCCSACGAPRLPPYDAAGCACNAPDAPAVVLDPFGGSGTTALVALRHGRSAALCEINPDYVALAQARIAAGR